MPRISDRNDANYAKWAGPSSPSILLWKRAECVVAPLANFIQKAPNFQNPIDRFGWESCVSQWRSVYTFNNLKMISSLLWNCQALNHEIFFAFSAARAKRGRNLFPLRSQSRVGRFWHSANGHIGSELRNLIIIQAVEEGRANKAQSESLNPMRDDSALSRWSRPTV